ncbi:hypothetical protein As57867_004519, partial [Aphanomyces stellatus]
MFTSTQVTSPSLAYHGQCLQYSFPHLLKGIFALRNLRIPPIIGLLYVVATGAISVIYLVIAAPSLANDHWWPRFSTVGVQTFLGDLYNAKLALNATGALDLLATSSLVHKDYSTGTAFISMRPATARAILLDRIPIPDAIRTIRSISLNENMRTTAPACWLDFNRTYEMAHTAPRQAKCNAGRTANAAVYLESLLRNVANTDLLSSTYYADIQSNIFTFVATTPNGASWVEGIQTHTWPSIADEATLWTIAGLTTFKNQLQNYYLEGIVDDIFVTNALGMRQKITINYAPAVTRPKNAWSSQYITCGLWNDLATDGAGLIRADPNFFEVVNGPWDYWYFNPGGTPATGLIRAQLGPLA